MGYIRHVGAIFLLLLLLLLLHPHIAGSDTYSGPRPEPIHLEGQPVVMEWRKTTDGCKIFAPSIFHPRNGRRLEVVWGGTCKAGYASGGGHTVSSKYRKYFINSEFITYSAVPFVNGVAHVTSEYFEKYHRIDIFDSIFLHSLECSKSGKILAIFRVKDRHVAHANGAFEIYGLSLILESWAKRSCPSSVRKLPVETIFYKMPFEAKQYEVYIHAFSASALSHPMHFVRSVEYGWDIAYKWRLALDQND